MARFLLAVAGIWTIIAAWRRRRGRLPARAVIVSPRRSTTISHDGAVESIQSAELTLGTADLERLWSPASLENLGRTYWRFLSRVTLGVIRVAYTQHDRSVMFLGRPLTLLRFDKPDYLLEPDHGSVHWPIRDGLLVARAGRGKGFLALDVRRSDRSDGGADASATDAKLRIAVTVSNFYPSIATGFSTPVYKATQSAVHVLVAHAFLRSLATLDLAQSRIGRLAGHVVNGVNPDSTSAKPAGQPAGVAAEPEQRA